MKKKCIAMLLAGGQGSRLGVLTAQMAKPAVPYGGKYRIIDFPLSNCSNSSIDTVGVLTQYMPMQLNSYLGTGAPWDLDRNQGGIYVLPPYQSNTAGEWYRGTANAIYQNINFIEQYDPTYVLVLGGDHIYKMDYAAMIDYHEKNAADVTIAALSVPWAEASRFGILNTDERGAIVEFDEKPKVPKSNQASMGIYVFGWEQLREYLLRDEQNPDSSNDFGKNVLPAMLEDGKRMFAYQFDGYWKDVGTIESLWEANMDLLATPPTFDLYDSSWRIYSNLSVSTPHYVGPGAEIEGAVVCEGAQVYGKVVHSVVSGNTRVGEDTQVIDSIIMPRAQLGERTKIVKAIVCEGAQVGHGCVVGDENQVTVIGPGVRVPDGTTIPAGVQVDEDYFSKNQR